MGFDKISFDLLNQYGHKREAPLEVKPVRALILQRDRIVFTTARV